MVEIKRVIMTLVVALLTSCAPRPEPLPAPLPTAGAVWEDAPEYVMWLPVVASGNAPKAGVAFSSHTDGAARVALLGRSVAYWRGWQVGGSLPGDQWGLKYTPSLWCDFFARQGVTLELRPQLHVLDLLGRDYPGPLLFLNEPDMAFYGRHGQCEVSPFRAAQIYAHTKAKLPNAQIIGPGLSHTDYENDFQWLDAWWNAVVALTGKPPEMYAWDIHNYIQTGSPVAPYNALAAWLMERGVENPRFWISEWGSCSPARTRLMKAAFDADPRIEHHYWYDQYMATWDGEPRCMSLFVEGRSPLQLSDVGRAFMGGAYTSATSAYP